MCYQILFSPQVKRCEVVTYKHGMYNFLHEASRVAVSLLWVTHAKKLPINEWQGPLGNPEALEKAVKYAQRQRKNTRTTSYPTPLSSAPIADSEQVNVTLAITALITGFVWNIKSFIVIDIKSRWNFDHLMDLRWALRSPLMPGSHNKLLS